MQKIKVSIVTLTYNQEKLISRTIDAILAQKGDFDIELIIGEDCSTDNTRQIVLDYQEKYPEIVKVITSDTNVGIEKNYLRCYQACNSKYVAVCDGDDYWIDNLKLQKQIDFLEKNTNYGLVGTGINNYNIDTNDVYIKEIVKDDVTYSLASVFLRNPFTASTVLFRQTLLLDFLKLYKENTALDGFVDYSLWLFFASKMKVAILKDICVAYGMSDTNISQTSDFKKAWQYRKRNYKRFKFFSNYLKSLDDTIIEYGIYNRAIRYYRLVAVNQDKDMYQEFIDIFKKHDKQRLYLFKRLIKTPSLYNAVTLYEKTRDKFFGVGEKTI